MIDKKRIKEIVEKVSETFKKAELHKEKTCNCGDCWKKRNG